MGGKQKQTQVKQKGEFERKLKDRLVYLNEKGIKSSEINKDGFVKKLEARIRAMDVRLKTIADQEKKVEELAKRKAEKAAKAAAPEKKAAPEKAPEEGKEKKKKKAKEKEKEKEKE